MSRTRHVAVAWDGTRIVYRLRGEGTPVVLLPGQANDHTWWRRTAPAFAEHHLVVLLDPRGTGESDAPDGPYSTPQLADDVVAVLDHAGLADAHVYGTSMGGRVGQWLGARHPGLVRSLALGCTSPGGPHAHERSAETRASLNLRDQALARQRLLDLMYTPRWRERNPGPYTVTGSRTMTLRTRRCHLEASDAHDAWDALPDIAAPTLVLHGSDDLMTPAANLPLLVDRIPGARGHAFDGARHAYFDECADDATPRVLEHWAAADRSHTDRSHSDRDGS